MSNLISDLQAASLTPQEYYDGFHLYGDEELDRLRVIRGGLKYDRDPESKYSKACDLENQRYHEVYNERFGALGEFVEVEQVGGEGEGDHYHIVLYFEKYDEYVRSDAYYASYHGVSDFSDWYIVTKQERTITVYE